MYVHLSSAYTQWGHSRSHLAATDQGSPRSSGFEIDTDTFTESTAEVCQKLMRMDASDVPVSGLSLTHYVHTVLAGGMVRGPSTRSSYSPRPRTVNYPFSLVGCRSRGKAVGISIDPSPIDTFCRQSLSISMSPISLEAQSMYAVSDKLFRLYAYSTIEHH